MALVSNIPVLQTVISNNDFGVGRRIHGSKLVPVVCSYCYGCVYFFSVSLLWLP
jgi:glutaredoxin 2